jgi:hypothetical protein
MTDATATATDPIGDSLPAILPTYYDAIDSDRFEEAAATLGSDGRYAVPLPGMVETGPRTETTGSAALFERFTERGTKPWRHVVRLCVVEGADALVEGVLVDDRGAAISTFVGSARIGERGLIERYLAFSCPGARDPIPTDVDPTAIVRPASPIKVTFRRFR